VDNAVNVVKEKMEKTWFARELNVHYLSAATSGIGDEPDV
jgi:hypothetical protein